MIIMIKLFLSLFSLLSVFQLVAGDNFEVIIQKYEAFGYDEIVYRQHQKYLFR